MDELTSRQRQVLEFLTLFIENNGYPPSHREIAASLNINGTRGVLGHLEALERKGYLKKEAGSSRGIALTSHISQSLALPIVGTVRAGHLQPAIEDVQGYFAVDIHDLRGVLGEFREENPDMRRSQRDRTTWTRIARIASD